MNGCFRHAEVDTDGLVLQVDALGRGDAGAHEDAACLVGMARTAGPVGVGAGGQIGNANFARRISGQRSDVGEHSIVLHTDARARHAFDLLPLGI